MHQLERQAIFNSMHQGIGDAHGNIEVAQVALILCADEFLDVRMVAAQHAHLSATTRTCRFNGFA